MAQPRGGEFGQGELAGLTDLPPPRPLGLLEWARTAVEPYGWTPARHHILLLERLHAIAEGAIDRLLVLMPPGSAKSTYASQIFPAWWFHRHPGSAVIAAAHTAELASSFGRGVRNLVSEFAPELGYTLRRDNHAAHRFETSNRGVYFAAGLGGTITGRRADLVLIDDPVKSHAEAEGALHRDAAWNWYRAELLPRLKPGGRVVMIMTRWHADDIAGRVMDSSDGWTVLRLPAFAEAGDALGRAPGEALWPEWESLAELERKRIGLGERVWASQYQQRPMAPGGTLFRVGRIAVRDVPPQDINWVRAWDLAATEATGRGDPDWTVGLKLGRDGEGRFVVGDIVRLRAGPYEVTETIAATAARDGKAVPIGLPQDPGQAGRHQVAWLTGRLAGYIVHASPESGAKAVRAMPVAAQIEAGNLTLLSGAWNPAFLAELEEFPLGRKDDQVDALSRAFAMLLSTTPTTRRMNVPLFAR